MAYLDIVSLVFGVLGGLCGLLGLHFIVFAIVGIFTRKKYPVAEEKCSIGIVVSARNEEKVIASLIKSVRKCNYPQDKIKIFVVAHNCTDATAQIARDNGAIVYEYNNPAERTKGYAFKYLFQMIERDYGISSLDGYLTLDADNVLTPEYLSKMNDAFVATGKDKVITSYRNSKNFAQNYMSCMYGLFFTTACRLESRGRTVCGCSTRVSGTGYLISTHILLDGWNYVTLTEDWEFSADVIACGNKICYCDEAEFFDEQPTTLKIMFRQRLRWAKGHMQVFFTRFKKVVSSIFHPKKYGTGGNFISKYDIGIQIMPLGVMMIVFGILQFICISLSPLFGYDLLLVYKEYAINMATAAAGSYVLFVLLAIFIIILEHKRIGKLPFFKTLAAILLWPLFLGLAVIQDFMALFVRKLEWKPIPHSYNKKETAEPDEKVQAENQT